jgi:tyrosyl-tRNA synthetase
MNYMNTKQRLELIQEVGEEILSVPELDKLLSEKRHPVAYDGIEPSGKMHIAQGTLRSININKILRAGCHFKMLLADWHSWANNKLGGDLDKIQTAGRYLIELWRGAGMDVEGIKFVWVSDYVEDQDYWKRVMQVARHCTVKRILRCSQIMGRKEGESLNASQIFYPAMQCADIFHLEADIAQLGMDQRKVNVLARELAPKLGWRRPVAVHHHMLMGLSKPPMKASTNDDRIIDLKMSKSNPNSAIFMLDSPEQVTSKIRKAYAPERQVAENPILEYCRYIIFQKYNEVTVERAKKHGGDILLRSYNELENLYRKGDLHPMDLKNMVASKLNEILEPVRKHILRNSRARRLAEEVENFTVTR